MRRNICFCRQTPYSLNDCTIHYTWFFRFNYFIHQRWDMFTFGPPKRKISYNFRCFPAFAVENLELCEHECYPTGRRFSWLPQWATGKLSRCWERLYNQIRNLLSGISGTWSIGSGCSVRLSSDTDAVLLEINPFLFFSCTASRLDWVLVTGKPCWIAR